MKVVVRDLTYAYEASIPVVSGLDLDVASGSVHALVGPNGCGKSTVLRLIAGLAKPSRGTIHFIGERRHDNMVALVFQEARLLPHWTVERNVAIGAEFVPRPKSLYRRIRDFHTSGLGLSHVRDQRPDALSLGEQTLAGLARGLAYDGEVVLLDEPFAHLDAPRRWRMREQFETHWQLEPQTTLIVTHDIDEAVIMGDRVSVMSGTPGPIVDTVEVELPRPRLADQAHDPAFRAARDRVWEALESA